MKIIGTAILARKAIVTHRFGSDAWRLFFADVVRREPHFRNPVTANSPVPVDAFLAFHDELLRRFYGGRRDMYFSIGEESAQWALTVGPYGRFLAARSVEAFVSSFPRLWSTYFTETDAHCKASFAGGTVDLEAFGISEHHPYFELLVVGYLKGALDLLCGNPIGVRRIDERNAAAYHYQFDIGTRASEPSPVQQLWHQRCPPSSQGPSDAARPHDLSERELQVLRMAARGMTNKEIGGVLDISWRTVQNHMSSVYRKVGLNTRAGAAAWLIEHDVGEARQPSSIRDIPSTRTIDRRDDEPETGTLTRR